MGFELTRRAALALGALGLTGVAARAANPMKITIQLNGQQQVPPVQTNGTGTANLTYDPSTRKLSWDISYQNLRPCYNGTYPWSRGPDTERTGAGMAEQEGCDSLKPDHGFGHTDARSGQDADGGTDLH